MWQSNLASVSLPRTRSMCLIAVVMSVWGGCGDDFRNDWQLSLRDAGSGQTTSSPLPNREVEGAHRYDGGAISPTADAGTGGGALPDAGQGTGGGNHTDAGAGGTDGGGMPAVDGGPPHEGHDAGVSEPEPWDPGPNALDPAALFQCNLPPASTTARLRRLERREWTHLVGKPLSGTWWGSVAKDNPFDAPGHLPYSTYAEGVTVDETTLDLYFAVLPEAGAGWTARSGGPGGTRTYAAYNDAELRCIWNDAQPTQDCSAYFVDAFLRKAVFFRPPRADEFDRLHTFLLEKLALENDVTERTATLSQVTQAAWLMTGALFKSEEGEPDPGPLDDDRRRLTNHELARALGGVLSTFAPGESGVFAWQAGPPEHLDWTAPPGGYLAGIAAAADDGSIQDTNVLASLVDQYLGGIDANRYDIMLDSGMSRRIKRGQYWLAPRVGDFFREWLGYTEVRTLFKDTPRKTSAWDGAYTGDPMYDPITTAYQNLLSGYYGDESLLDEQLDDTIARVIIEDVDVFSRLMTTRKWHLASNLSQTNGVSCMTSSDCSSPYPNCTDLQVCGSSIWRSTTNSHRIYSLQDSVENSVEGRWVDMPASERSGVLTHPAWLAAHGGNFEDDASLVHRGKWIRENLLCEVVPPLELVQVEAKLVASAPELSARARVVASIETGPDAPLCMGCHAQMNSLGYPFEIYNHAGLLRANDHGSPPSGQSTIDNAPDPLLNRTVTDAVELTSYLAESQVAKRCFIRQTFRFFMGRDETLADGCTLLEMESAYDARGSFADLLKSLVVSEPFRYRTVGAGESP